MTDHTPLPWKAVKSPRLNGNPDLWEIHWSDDGECVAEIVHDEANAAFIIRACNSHYDLIEALEDALSGWRYIREQHGDLFGVGWDRVENAALAALAKAKGE